MIRSESGRAPSQSICLGLYQFVSYLLYAGTHHPCTSDSIRITGTRFGAHFAPELLFSDAKTLRPALLWRAQPQHLGHKTRTHELRHAAALCLPQPLLCGQDIARTSSAGARLPPPRAAMRGRREAPGTAKCGARPEFSGKGTCLPGSAPCAPQELQQATRAHGELEKSGTDEHLAPPTCTAAAAFFAGCPG